MSPDVFFNAGFLFYFSAVITSLFALIFRKQAVKVTGILLGIAFVFHTVVLAARFAETRQPPFVSLYESMLFYSWSVVCAYFLFMKKYRLGSLAGVISAVSLVMFGVLSLLDRSVQPLVPALKSNWLFIHVISYFIGYGGATLSFIFSLIYLVNSRRAGEQFLSGVDLISFRLIAFAFIFLTVGLTTGSVWANVAWGSWWSWDPKETWSLITWLVYAFYLHLRLIKGSRGGVCAWINIGGFLCVLFTFFGVNYLLSGLHSYM